MRGLFAGLAILGMLVPASVQAAGDLLVAPTRVILDGRRGTEVLLNNIGAEPATYRISLELKRMDKDGSIDEVAPEAANDKEKQAVAMISYAPRRIVLPPNQPQAIRIGLRAPANLPDGEYRAHMLFRAVPEARPAGAAGPAAGISIALTPVYGISIPIIVRKGTLQAIAGMANPRILRDPKASRPELALTLTRKGTRSVAGTIRVLKPGQSKPVIEINGIAVYPEVESRDVRIALDEAVAAAMTGPVTIQYVEDAEAGGKVMAEVKTVLR
jgi:hypothetical protein